jgi:hypothetical protein
MYSDITNYMNPVPCLWVLKFKGVRVEILNLNTEGKKHNFTAIG